MRDHTEAGAGRAAKRHRVADPVHEVAPRHVLVENAVVVAGLDDLGDALLHAFRRAALEQPGEELAALLGQDAKGRALGQDFRQDREQGVLARFIGVSPTLAGSAEGVAVDLRAHHPEARRWSDRRRRGWHQLLRRDERGQHRQHLQDDAGRVEDEALHGVATGLRLVGRELGLRLGAHFAAGGDDIPARHFFGEYPQGGRIGPGYELFLWRQFCFDASQRPRLCRNGVGGVCPPGPLDKPTENAATARRQVLADSGEAGPV